MASPAGQLVIQLIQEIVEVKRLASLIAPVVTPANLPVLMVSGAGISLTRSNVANKKITTGRSEANNSLTSATITITMTNRSVGIQAQSASSNLTTQKEVETNESSS
jgi:hypothetical protein